MGITLFPRNTFKPIDAAARSGKPFLVKRGPTFARARWHDGFWIYDIPEPMLHVIDFEPTDYSELVR